MALTPEQQERIRINRERALAIRQKKQEEEKRKAEEEIEETRQKEKRRRVGVDVAGESTTGNKEDEDTKLLQLDVLEQFEENASPWATKKEAVKMYCLPEGTLAVCECEERENPHNKSWKPMKMYKRSELRMWARRRFGSLQGLVSERNKREEKRLIRDMAKANEIFSTKK